jgi:hypothetical protein
MALMPHSFHIVPHRAKSKRMILSKGSISIIGTSSHLYTPTEKSEPHCFMADNQKVRSVYEFISSRRIGAEGGQCGRCYQETPVARISLVPSWIPGGFVSREPSINIGSPNAFPLRPSALRVWIGNHRQYGARTSRKGPDAAEASAQSRGRVRLVDR